MFNSRFYVNCHLRRHFAQGVICLVYGRVRWRKLVEELKIFDFKSETIFWTLK